MIDTIRFNLAETRINDNAAIILQPGDIDFNSNLQPENDLFITDSGKRIRGKKAFINNEFFNLTILPKLEVDSEQKKEKKVEYLQKIYGRSRDGSIELEKKELHYIKDNSYNYNSKIFLQTSLPKINNYLTGSNNYNLKSLSNDEILSSLKFVFSELYKLGVKTDLEYAIINRMDLFNNVLTDLEFKEYKMILGSLELSRKKLTEFSGETFLYGNKSHQFTIYDKTNEMLLKHKIDLLLNVMRFENRFMNKKKIFNTFKHFVPNAMGNGMNIKLLLERDLLKDEMYKIGSKIFDRKKLEIELISQDELYEKLEMLKGNNRYWLKNFFYNEGLTSVLNRIPKTILLNVLRDLLTKDKFYKIKREISLWNFNMSIFSDSKMINLFDELKEKYFNNLKSCLK